MCHNTGQLLLDNGMPSIHRRNGHPMAKKSPKRSNVIFMLAILFYAILISYLLSLTSTIGLNAATAKDEIVVKQRHNQQQKKQEKGEMPPKSKQQEMPNNVLLEGTKAETKVQTENAKQFGNKDKLPSEMAPDVLASEQRQKEQPGISRILVTLAPNGKSHARSLLPLVNRLALAGHRVHVFHIISQSQPETTLNNNPNITVIEVPILENMDQMVGQFGRRVWSSTMHSSQLALPYHMMGQVVANAVKRNPDKIAEVFNADWDLLLTSELFNVHGFGLSRVLYEKRHVPVATYSSTRMMNSHAYYNAIGQSWVTHLHPFSPAPTHSHDIFDSTNFKHRLINVLESLGELVTDVFIEKVLVAPTMALITGKREFSFAQLFAQREITFVEGISFLGSPQSVVPDVLSIGAHCEPASELSKDYRDFVEDPKSKGTIYVAFGTFTPWDFAPPGLANAFFDAFERLPDYRFLFSFHGKHPARQLSAHIRLVDWAPQMDVLSHPNTRVFLTHCGLKSIKESLCSRTPILGMPVFAEQNYNARMMIQYGTGIALNKFYVDTEQLYAGLKELLDNPKYAQRVNKMQQIFLDRPANALDEGEFHVRKIIRKGKQRMGKHHFRRKGIGMDFVPFFSFDFALLILLLVFTITK